MAFVQHVNIIQKLCHQNTLLNLFFIIILRALFHFELHLAVTRSCVIIIKHIIGIMRGQKMALATVFLMFIMRNCLLEMQTHKKCYYKLLIAKWPFFFLLLIIIFRFFYFLFQFVFFLLFIIFRFFYFLFRFVFIFHIIVNILQYLPNSIFWFIVIKLNLNWKLNFIIHLKDC